MNGTARPAAIDSATLAALHEALEDEYRARATYAAVIEKFGLVRPFVNIIGAEDRHAAALTRLFQRYGLPVPADRWAGRVSAPASIQEALAAGVQAEIENRAMYDRLMAMTRLPDVLQVFDNLRRASQENHLPAFQRAAAVSAPGSFDTRPDGASRSPGKRPSARTADVETGLGDSRHWRGGMGTQNKPTGDHPGPHFRGGRDMAHSGCGQGRFR